MCSHKCPPQLLHNAYVAQRRYEIFIGLPILSWAPSWNRLVTPCLSRIHNLRERYWRIVLIVKERSCRAHQGPSGRLLFTVAVTCRLLSIAIDCGRHLSFAVVGLLGLRPLALCHVLGCAGRLGQCLAMIFHKISKTLDLKLYMAKVCQTMKEGTWSAPSW
ncbi:unnamed protein product [Prunus armeniaca]